MPPSDKLAEGLRNRFDWYAKNFLQVIDKGQFVPFDFRPAQERLWVSLQEQHAEGKPMRAIILKARKLGFSTFAQGLMLQRATQIPNHNAVVVAQDVPTASELFNIGQNMYNLLPDDPRIKPPIAFTRRARALIFGQPAREARMRGGDLGINSSLRADGASEFKAGRGFTNSSLHLSELAWWDHPQKKLTSMLNTVESDNPNTMVLIESTANGFNHFREMWIKAEQGQSDYLPFFAGWQEDPRYRKAFHDDEERGAFEESVGTGPWGEDEPDLQQQGLTLEQLHWRRWAIENLAGSNLEEFKQEYPSTPGEAFLTTGRKAFAGRLIDRARRIAELTDPQAREVILEAKREIRRPLRHIVINVPVEVHVREPRSREAVWRVWTEPEENGRYVIAVDPSQGEENTVAESDYSAIQVIDHRSRKQVAEYRSKADATEIALQTFLAALWFSQGRAHSAIVAVEMSGGHGTFIATRVWKEYGHKGNYFRKSVDPTSRDRTSDRVGFSTDRATKNALVDGMADLLREDDPGVRSLLLASEISTYIRDGKGRTGAESDKHDDLLTAFMIGQYVAHEKPPKSDRPTGPVRMSTRPVLNPVTGW